MTKMAHQGLDLAFEKIEETILPSISMLLDTLLDAASISRPGFDAEIHAAELRAIGVQLEHLTREVEAVSPVWIGAQASNRRISA